MGPKVPSASISLNNSERQNRRDKAASSLFSDGSTVMWKGPASDCSRIAQEALQCAK